VTRVFTDQQTLYVFFRLLCRKGGCDFIARRTGIFPERSALDTPMVAPAEYEKKTRAASFRISLLLRA